MPKITFAGHPLHPQLVELPAGLIPTSLVFDVAYFKTRDKKYMDAAYMTLLTGYIGAAGAAMAGAGDYFAIPTGTRTKRLANTHLLLNIGLMAMTGLNLLRRRGKKRLDAMDIAMSAIGNAALLVSTWYGGQMVYGRGLRVAGKSEISDAPEWALPGDEMISDALSRLPDGSVPVEEREEAFVYSSGL